MDFYTNIESAFSPMILRRFNTWYSVNDGNWSDPNTWMSNALDKKTRTSPQAGDNVYINHTVTLDTTISIKNIYVSGTFKADNSSRILTVTGDIQATGSVDFTGSNVTVALNGVNNFIVSFTCGASSTIQYVSSMTQPVMPITYRNLSLLGGTAAVKYLQANLTVNSALVTNSILNTNGFDISVGTSTTGTGQVATINSTTNILFVGAVSFGGGGVLNIVGASSIECRGGMTFASLPSSWSSSNVNFTTNNQTITIASSQLTVNNITITGAITVNTASGNNPLVVNGTINGTVAGSTFNNNGWLQLSNSTLPMATGVFNYANTAGSSLSYAFNGNYTLPYTSYHTLILSGTGIKTLAGNTTLANNLNLSSQLELSTFNLTVTGTSQLSGAAGYITKSGSGSIIFGGSLSAGSGSVNTDLSAGNPTIEFRGGLSINNGAFNFGTGAITFSTNNQSISGINWNTYNNPITINSGITVTIAAGSGGISTNTVTGVDAISIFINNGNWTHNNATAPMSTGKLYCNQATNTFIYGLAGNQDIQVPSDPVSPGYKNLTLNGSGAKKLLGNVSVKGVYTLTGPATLNSNGFALTNP